MTPKELREKRAALVKQARAMLDRADKEKRALTAAEREQYDKAFAEIEELKDEIDRREKQDALDREMASGTSPVVGPTLAGEDRGGGRAGGPRETWVDARTGRSIPVLGIEQRMADLPEARVGDHDPNALSVGRLIAAIARGSWAGAEAERRAMSGGVPSAGGVFLFEPIAAVLLDKVRAATVLGRAGMRTVPMTTADLTLVRVERDVVPVMKGENEEFVEQEFGFGPVHLGARTVGCLVSLSRELAADAVNAASLIETELVKVLAVSVDRLGLAGVGGKEPVGLSVHPDIQRVPDVGNIDWDQVLDVIELVENENIEPSAYIVSPAVKKFLARIKSGIGEYDKSPAEAAALTRLPTTAATAGTLTLGGFGSMLMGLRQDAALEVSSEAGDAFKKHQIHIKMTLRLDFALGWPRHIAQMSGITG